MRRHLRPACRVGRARPGDGTVHHAERQALVRLCEADGYGRTAERLDEFGEVLVVHPDLETLDVRELCDRLLAEQNLRPERPDAEQLHIELLLQALVDEV